ncbi:hypothetical protein BH11BAC4_BH11BAC4_09040 [soil metagenome]
MKKAVFCFLIICSACNDRKKVEKPPTVTPATEIPSEEKKLKDAITKYPDSLLLKENLVQYFRDNGNYFNAIKTIDEAIKKDSGKARLWDIKATLHFEDADTVNSIKAFEKAIDLFPDPQYIISLGTLFAQTKNPLALQMADALLIGSKANAGKEAFFIKGLYYTYINEKQKSIVFFDKCLSLNYTFMDAYREKAIALYDLGKYEEALVVLDKAITLQNNFDEGYYYSGQCLEKLNRKTEAIQAYQNAIICDPNYIEAKDALAKLGVKY